jgi:transcriptional regulator with XRE-family HTH domain
MQYPKQTSVGVDKIVQCGDNGHVKRQGVKMQALQSYLIATRTNAKLSQEAAADLVGITGKTVGRWESGENEPKMSELIAYIEAIGGSAYRAVDLLLGRQPAVGSPDEPPAVLATREMLANLPPDILAILAPIAERMQRGE